MVTGDIAFAGKREEYDHARDWLAHLCEILGCAQENVWVTPGNHDVDRFVVNESPLLQEIHKKLRTTDIRFLDNELQRWLVEDKLVSSIFFKPIENYIEFASKFGCQISPDQPYWERDFTLNDGSKLRLRGLNSTLVSDNGDDLALNKLILGSAQCTLARQNGVQYMTLCHHPPQWLQAQDKIEESLNARARIQLYGHKHYQRLERINDSLRLTAGAVHPDRMETGWQPRYNLMSIIVENKEADRSFVVEVYPRVWDDADHKFKADYDSKGVDNRCYSLPIERWTRPEPVQTPRVEIGETQEIEAVDAEAQSEVPEANVMDPARRLTYRFLTLPYHDRIKIAQTLGLIKDDDKGLEDAELFKHFFRRAKDENLLARFWEEVESYHKDGKARPNPFERGPIGED